MLSISWPVAVKEPHRQRSDALEVGGLPAQAGACGEGDALYTTGPGLALSVVTADCVPVLLAGPEGLAAVLRIRVNLNPHRVRIQFIEIYLNLEAMI